MQSILHKNLESAEFTNKKHGKLTLQSLIGGSVNGELFLASYFWRVTSKRVILCKLDDLTLNRPGGGAESAHRLVLPSTVLKL